MRLRLLVLALLALSVVPTWGGQADASCAAPQLEVVGQEHVRRPVLTIGTEVTIRGQHFLDGCADSLNTDTNPGIGCSGENDSEPEDRASKDVAVHLLYGSLTKLSQLELGRADAGERGSGNYGELELTFTVPDVTPGPAFIKTSRSEPLRVRIR